MSEAAVALQGVEDAYPLAPAQAGMLVAQIGPKPGTLERVLESLSLATGGQRPVSSEDIQALIEKDRAQPIYQFVNALLDRQGPVAFSRLRDMLAQGVVSGKKAKPERDPRAIAPLKKARFRRSRSKKRKYRGKNINGCLKDAANVAIAELEKKKAEVDANKPTPED